MPFEKSRKANFSVEMNFLHLVSFPRLLPAWLQKATEQAAPARRPEEFASAQRTESSGTTVEHQDVQLSKGLKEILKSSVLSDISTLPPPECQLTRLSVLRIRSFRLQGRVRVKI